MSCLSSVLLKAQVEPHERRIGEGEPSFGGRLRGDLVWSIAGSSSVAARYGTNELE
jgi:hypothetical protein